MCRLKFSSFLTTFQIDTILNRCGICVLLLPAQLLIFNFSFSNESYLVFHHISVLSFTLLPFDS